MHRLLGGCLVVSVAVFLSVAWPRVAAGDKSEVIHLFNGKDLTHFYTYLGKYGRNNDPEKVFTVHDGMIHVTGKVFGGLVTEEEYENYHLVVEYAWGEKTWPPRENDARDSGILLHCTGGDGSAGKGSVWMTSLECQMIEGGTGDLIPVGPDHPTFSSRVEKRKNAFYYQPDAPSVPIVKGRVNWCDHDPELKYRKGCRGKQDVEKPVGEWNVLECVCDGNRLTYVLNGKVVNGASDVSVTRGKILFQSEGAELFFRKIDLRPLKKK